MSLGLVDFTIWPEAGSIGYAMNSEPRWGNVYGNVMSDWTLAIEALTMPC